VAAAGAGAAILIEVTVLVQYSTDDGFSTGCVTLL